MSDSVLSKHTGFDGFDLDLVGEHLSDYIDSVDKIELLKSDIVSHIKPLYTAILEQLPEDIGWFSCFEVYNDENNPESEAKIDFTIATNADILDSPIDMYNIVRLDCDCRDIVFTSGCTYRQKEYPLFINSDEKNCRIEYKDWFNNEPNWNSFVSMCVERIKSIINEHKSLLSEVHHEKRV